MSLGILGFIVWNSGAALPITVVAGGFKVAGSKYKTSGFNPGM